MKFIDKELIEYGLLNTEKDCLKRGTKISSDDYQLCWCEKTPLFARGYNERNCYPYRINTFQTGLKKEMNES